jgi:hypothetical protein
MDGGWGEMEKSFGITLDILGNFATLKFTTSKWHEIHLKTQQGHTTLF